MAERNNDTQSKINEEDRAIQQRQHSDEGRKADDFQGGSSSMPGGGSPEGRFAHQGDAATGEALDGGPDRTGNTGAELPGGAQSEFARTSGGQSDGVTASPSASNPATGAGGAQPGGTNRGAQGGSMQGTTGEQASGAPGGQGVGSVGTIGGTPSDTTATGETSAVGANQSPAGMGGGSEYRSAIGSSSQEPLGAGHQQSADGGSVTAAASGSTKPGPGQTGSANSKSERSDSDATSDAS